MGKTNNIAIGRRGIHGSAPVTTRSKDPAIASATDGKTCLRSPVPSDLADRRRWALEDYARTQDSAKTIAARHGIDIRRLRSWVDAAGYARRPLGRQPRSEPPAAQRAILRQIGLVPIPQLALQLGKSRQYLSGLAKRWADWIRANPTNARGRSRPTRLLKPSPPVDRFGAGSHPPVPPRHGPARVRPSTH